jgi:hypothetical protein
MPLLVCVAEQGTGRGSAESHRHRSAGAPGVELIIYPVRHFDVFTGPTRRQLLQDQVALVLVPGSAERRGGQVVATTDRASFLRVLRTPWAKMSMSGQASPSATAVKLS